VSHDDLPERKARDIARTIAEQGHHLDELWTRSLSPAEAGELVSIPFHPGALEYQGRSPGTEKTEVSEPR
jgi:hypothetical protein